MTQSIIDLAAAIANIKCLGATQEISLRTMSDMEARYAEEHARRQICHMMAHEIAEGIEKFEEKLIQGRYVGGLDPQLQFKAELYVITPEDYKELVRCVRAAQRYLDATTAMRDFK